MGKRFSCSQENCCLIKRTEAYASYLLAWCRSLKWPDLTEHVPHQKRYIQHTRHPRSRIWPLTIVFFFSKMRCGAAAVVVALACSRPSNDWPELFPTLVRMLESPSNPEVEGAFATLLCFSENAPQRFKAEARPIDRLVPALISFLQDSALPRQGNALTCLVNLGTAHSPLLAPHADALFSGIAVGIIL